MVWFLSLGYGQLRSGGTSPSDKARRIADVSHSTVTTRISSSADLSASQREVSNRCQIDYVIDTRFDKTLFAQQAVRLCFLPVVIYALCHQ